MRVSKMNNIQKLIYKPAKGVKITQGRDKILDNIPKTYEHNKQPRKVLL